MRERKKSYGVRRSSLMNVKDIKHLAVERIYLVPDTSEGRLGYVWCDDPAPGEGMDASEAVEYVRKDVSDARIAELERERDAYRAAEEYQIALRQKIERERDQAAAHISELKCAIIRIAHDHDLGENQLPSQELMDDASGMLSLARRDAIKQAEVLDRLSELLKETHLDKAPNTARACMHVNDAINRVKQEFTPIRLSCRTEALQ